MIPSTAGGAGTVPICTLSRVSASDDRLRHLTAEPEAFLADSDPVMRRLAVSAVANQPGDPATLESLLALLRDDPEPAVRAEAAEVAGGFGHAAAAALLAAVATEEDPRVVEAIVTGLGEVEDAAAVPWLMEMASGHDDRLVREAAVAALGAIGDPAAIPLLLDLVASAPPQVRRRCVVALTAFDGPEVEAALHSALADRNPMVREAAEMVVGRPFDDGTWSPVTLRGGGDGTPAS